MLKKELKHDYIQLDLVNNKFYRFRIYNYPVDTSNFELLAPKFLQTSKLIKKKYSKEDLKNTNFEIEFTASKDPNLPDQILISQEFEK